MYLRQIDLHGFKSFADKNELHFLEGINAVVGPNGSGKSNISDAIRWVLGEQSAKSLRADKMNDVIFNGTEKRKQMGFAEVSLYIDNTDRRIPVDFSEINITRRMFRSGESEFYLNKVQCRMKDIHELFMDTGIGKEGYSIIGQGRIDEILSNRSEDRRLIFEEAAGIVKYRVRKEQAERKLENAKQNMLRINDIITEIEGQKEPLREQADVAKQYQVIIEELKKVEINFFLYSIDKIKLKLESVASQIEAMDEFFASKNKALLELESKLDILKHVVEEGNKEISEQIENIHHKKAEKQAIEADIHLQTERKKNILESIELYNKQIKDSKEEMLSINETRKRLEEERLALNALLKSEEEELKEKETIYYDKHQLLFQLEGEEKKKQQEILDAINDLMEHKSSLTMADTFVEGIVLRKQQFIDELETLKSSIASKYGDIEDASEDIGEFEKLISKNTELFEKKKQSKVQKEQEKFNFERDINRLNANNEATLSRLKVLEELENEHSGYSKAVKSMLQDVTNVRRIASGFCGVLGDLISVQDKYVMAIELAIGGAIQNIVTETDIDAKNLIEHLKKNKWGRATFFPINTIKPRNLRDDEKRKFELTGFLGVATDFVNCNTKYKPILSNILGRVIIVDNIDNAMAIARKTSYDYKIVTLDGEVLNAGGSMSGGSAGGNGFSVLSRKNEINALKVNLAVAKEELLEKQEKLEIMKEDLLDIDREIMKENANIQKLGIDYNNLKNNKDNIEKEILNLKHRITTIASDIVVSETDEANSREEIKIYKAKQDEAEKKKHKIEKEQLKLLEKINQQKNINEEDTRKINECKLKMTTTQQRVIALTQNEEILAKNLNSINNRQVKSDKEIKDLQIEIGQNDISIEARKNDYEKIIEVLVIEEEKLKIVEEQYVTKKENLDKGEQEIKDMQASIAKIKEDKYKEEANRLKAEMELENQEMKLLETYDMSYGRALKFKDETISISQASKRCGELKSEIREMGNVNVNAIEEYSKLTERYTLLTTQISDLAEAKESIEKIIAELLSTMKKQFISEFKKINESFATVFTDLFGGGSAELEILDEENILETGIDIIARPPGKKKQSLSLLSGGERALTAIALLFAIIRLKPSPFCVLDEIDAALDDANVDRYANYLQSISKTSQFIIITHRKGSMNVAGSLYGVSMQDSGVSNMLSVKFDENIDGSEE